MSNPKDPLSDVVDRLATRPELPPEVSAFIQDLVMRDMQADLDAATVAMAVMTRGIVQLLKETDKTEIFVPVADLKVDDFTQQVRVFLVPADEHCDEDRVDMEPVPVK